MSTLFLDRRGSRLELEGGHLRISLPEEGERSAETRRFPLGLIERIVLVARTELDSSTLAALSEAGVALVAFGGRRGERSAVLDGAPHRDAGLRIAQILAYSQPALRARLARVVVLAKLRASQRTLRHILACRPDLRKPLHDARLSLGSLREQLRSEPECDLARSRGFEGAAARCYFPALFAAFPPELGAQRRRRRPPPDPANAVLSLAYTLATAQAAQAARGVGFDPAVGFLHAPEHGRPALACDLVEPLRPTIDAWVWRLFAERTLRAEHFGRDGAGACLLGKAGRAHFYQAWAELSPALERRCRAQCRRLARWLRQRIPLPSEFDNGLHPDDPSEEALA